MLFSTCYLRCLAAGQIGPNKNRLTVIYLESRHSSIKRMPEKILAKKDSWTRLAWKKKKKKERGGAVPVAIIVTQYNEAGNGSVWRFPFFVISLRASIRMFWLWRPRAFESCQTMTESWNPDQNNSGEREF